MVDPLQSIDSTKDNLIDQIQDLQERLAELERFALTSQEIVATTIKCSGDIYTEELTPYQDTSYIVGWGSYTNKVIYYRSTGKMVHVWFYIEGESNSATTTISVLAAANATANLHNYQVIQVKNNGTYQVGVCNITPGTSTITFYSNIGHGSWTASGAKRVIGYLNYQAA